METQTLMRTEEYNQTIANYEQAIRDYEYEKALEMNDALHKATFLRLSLSKALCTSEVICDKSQEPKLRLKINPRAFVRLMENLEGFERQSVRLAEAIYLN